MVFHLIVRYVLRDAASQKHNRLSLNHCRFTLEMHFIFQKGNQLPPLLRQPFNLKGVLPEFIISVHFPCSKSRKSPLKQICHFPTSLCKLTCQNNHLVHNDVMECHIVMQNGDSWILDLELGFHFFAFVARN